MKLEIERNLFPNFKGLIISGLILILGVFLFQSGINDNNFTTISLISVILGVFNIILSILGIGFSTPNFFRPKTGLSINKNGIILKNGLLNSIGLIKWSCIKTTKIENRKNETYLIIVPLKPDEIVAKFSGLTKWNLKRNYKLLGSPITINLKTLKCDTNELHRIINNNLFEKQ